MAWGVTCRALVFRTRGSSGFAPAIPDNYKLSVSQSISLLHTTYCNPGVVSVRVSLSYDPLRLILCFSICCLPKRYWVRPCVGSVGAGGIVLGCRSFGYGCAVCWRCVGRGVVGTWFRVCVVVCVGVGVGMELMRVWLRL